MLGKTRGYLISILCLSLLFPFIGPRAEAQKSDITMVIGRPNIWSLAQAHYLLANMRETNRGLKAAFPGDLNPNSINGARLDVLRTLLGVEAQFSAPQGLQNRVSQQQFMSDSARKQSAVARLDELSTQHLQVIREISDLDIALASLGPQPPADKQNPDTELKRTELTQQRAAKVILRDAIAGQITTVSTQANAAATLSNLQNGFALGSPSPPSLPSEGIGDLKSIVDKLLPERSIPEADASQKLENFIDMQYEVIAKQLTLLRDELGPDERLVFLELPSSLYSVPKRDDDQVVQIDWKIAEYYGWCPGSRARSVLLSDAAVDERNRPEDIMADDALNEVEGRDNQAPPVTDELLMRFHQLRSQLDKVIPELDFLDQYQRQHRSARSKGESLLSAPDVEERAEKARNLITSREDVREFRQILRWYPELKEMGWVLTPNVQGRTRGPGARCALSDHESKVRVVDIIPRQSALNVNDAHATQKGLALTAKFLTLFGLGGQVSYQRQRSHYEQFITQDVFASGYGKGTEAFGWTMGPLPGTKRLAPGPRTTFAIVAIPSQAWQISLQARAVAFPRTKSPTNSKDSKHWTNLTATPVNFDLSVPNEVTNGFWVDSINYTPVPKGGRVMALIGGRYFSPLTGVMVDGVPLKRAVAVAKHESEITSLPNVTDSPGEYEYLNSKQILIAFKSPRADFVGTPLITLITPEKTSPINYFRDLRINFRPFVTSLQSYSLIEPMFIDELSLNQLQLSPQDLNAAPSTRISPRLVGAGFKRGAEICLQADGRVNCSLQPTLENTGVYNLTFDKPTDPVWTITYRLGQRTSSIVFDTNTDGQRAIAPTIDGIENPATNKAEGLMSGGYSVVIRGRNLQTVSQVFFGTTEVKENKIRERHANVLLVDVPPGKEGGVQVLLKGALLPAMPGQRPVQLSNILDFTTPGKAIFKYLKPDKPAGTTPASSPPAEVKPKRRPARRR